MIIYLLLQFFFNAIVLPGKMPPPPGTKMVNDTLFLDINLLSVISYDEFLFYIKIDTGFLGIDYKKCVPDSTIKYLGKPYLNSKKYNEDNPILNLTKYQMNAYCRWRSYVVSLYKNIPCNKTCQPQYWQKFEIADPLRSYNIEYSLPDSATINLYKPHKKINVTEIYRDDNASTLKYMHKHFDRDVIGFRCAARYVLRKLVE